MGVGAGVARRGSIAQDVRLWWKLDIREDSFAAMSSRPAVKLSVLRDIGWGQWDPIGLNEIEGGWQGSNAANEYDGYLLHVAAALQCGEQDSALVDYLIDIETRHMGASSAPSTETRAEATVDAIRRYMESIS